MPLVLTEGEGGAHRYRGLSYFLNRFGVRKDSLRNCFAPSPSPFAPRVLGTGTTVPLVTARP